MSHYKVEYDHFSKRKYYVFPAINETNKLSIFQEIRALRAPVTEIAEIGPDLSLQANDGSLIIIRDTKYNDFHPVKKNYKLSFKTAEFHTYLELLNINSNQAIHFGTAPDVKGSVSGNVYSRNDTYYDQKYFQGFLKFDPMSNNRLDQASNYVAFYIDDNQAKLVIDAINKHIEQTIYGKNYYNMLSIPNIFFSSDHSLLEDGQNCIDFISELHHHLGLTGPIFPHYYRFDEINMLDRGVMYLFYLVNGLDDFFVYNLGNLVNYFSQLTTPPNHESILLSISHNNQLDSSVIKSIIANATEQELNAFDDNGYTNPLFESARTGSNEVFKALLMDPRVDPHVKNINNDNVAHIAVYSNNIEALELLNEFAPSLLTEHNNERQAPLCYIRDCVNDPDLHDQYYLGYETLMHYANHYYYI